MMNESDSALENHSSDDEKTIVETTINIRHRKLNMSTSDPTRNKNSKNTKLHSNGKRLSKKKKLTTKWKKSDSIESTDYYESSSSTENDSLDEGSNDDDEDDPFDPTKNPSCQIPEFSLRGFQAPKYRTVVQKRRNNNNNNDISRPRFFSDGFFEKPSKNTDIQDQGNESNSDNNMNMNRNKQVYKSKNLIPRDPIDVTRNFFTKSLVEARTSLERSFGLF